MVNLKDPELAEISTAGLPRASLDSLKDIRNKMCSSSGGEFSLQSQQKFLRRVLSPDSPTRNLLMCHGTGTGKTCTAIQIAEEYILRPEFQDKRVMVVASRAVQENFRTQIFDMSRVNLDLTSQTLSSKQCTGRRYLDMLLRIESEPKNWSDPTIKSRLDTISDRIIKEFYEFSAYNSFGARINEHLSGTKVDIDEAWVHENFDNRLLIIDEAHNVREGGDSDSDKAITEGLEKLVKTANGLVLVLLTATPMFDSYEEIVYYMNLFRWNSIVDKTKITKDKYTASEFFNPDGSIKPGKPEETFRAWCQEYVSYVKGDNPFTFPFRLPPPVIAGAIQKNFKGKAIGDDERLKYLSLVASEAQGVQKEIVSNESAEDEEAKRAALMLPTVAVLPGNKNFKETFKIAGDHLDYVGKPFLTPEELPKHSAKFVSIINSIEKSTGVVLVYSNYKYQGAKLFAMALEEHGYGPAKGDSIFAKTKETPKGKYILLTSEASDAEISSMLELVKHRDNREGKNVRVVISSPLVSEGVDFRYMRQVHILDPWWNMSRIEQVVGRALRTCSHQLLSFEDQNCTVYLHVLRIAGDRETFDEYTYRVRVEAKAMKIMRVRKIMEESAMDCPKQIDANNLPQDWKTLDVPQRRAENNEAVTFDLQSMMAPAFDDSPGISQCKVRTQVEDPDHVRPLSSYLDVRDEILNRLGKLFIDKPIWDRLELFAAFKDYAQDVVVYTIQQAILNGFRFPDSFGRSSILESKGDLYALAPVGVPNSTIIERITQPNVRAFVDLPTTSVEQEAPIEVVDDIIDTKREAYAFPGDAKTRFSESVLNGFIFDHELSLPEKRAYLLTKPDLPFADRLYVPDTERIVLGDGVYEPSDDPIGDERSKIQQWTDGLIQTFIDNKSKLFASVAKNGKFTLSTSVIENDVPTRVVGQKRFEPTICSTGDNQKPAMILLSKYVDKEGVGIPENVVKKGSSWCTYAELLAREQNNIVWVTPEEMSVLTSKENGKKILIAFNPKVKKQK